MSPATKAKLSAKLKAYWAAKKAGKKYISVFSDSAKPPFREGVAAFYFLRG